MDRLRQLYEQLIAFDFGPLWDAGPDTLEAALKQLESIVDGLAELGVDVHAGDLAIRYFMTDLPRSREYLLGQTDIDDGVPLAEKLKRELLREQAKQGAETVQLDGRKSTTRPKQP